MVTHSGVSRQTRYACVVGHEIPTDELQSLTEVWSLDTGAEVRVCREHGAPVAISVRSPMNTAREGGVSQP